MEGRPVDRRGVVPAELDYRANFLISVLLGVAWQASVLVFATVPLGSFPGMSGWPRHAVLLLASMRMLSHGLSNADLHGAGEMHTRLTAAGCGKSGTRLCGAWRRPKSPG